MKTQRTLLRNPGPRHIHYENKVFPREPHVSLRFNLVVHLERSRIEASKCVVQLSKIKWG